MKRAHILPTKMGWGFGFIDGPRRASAIRFDGSGRYLVMQIMNELWTGSAQWVLFVEAAKINSAKRRGNDN